MADYIGIDAPIDFAVYGRNRRINATLRHLFEVNDAKYELADVRSVVTCGECKHWAENGTDYCSCDRDALLRERDFFCAAGEKREES